MTRSRRQQVSLEATPYYHCISRCVRRAFLCGSDPYTGMNFDHRRGWMLDRLAVLLDVFAVDLAAYALMFNHYHLVLRIDVERAQGWSEHEVARRWTRLFTGPVLIRRYLAGEVLDAGERVQVDSILREWRERLHDISWFMRCLNEHVARKANEEDGCKGRFWEGRFKSQALLDEKALLACMAYVDLNPVRAGLAVTPEASAYASIRQRAKAFHQASAATEHAHSGPGPRLIPLEDGPGPADRAATLCGVRLLDYFELVDWTGRAVRAGKKGAIPGDAPPVLDRLHIDRAAWLRHMRPRSNRMLQAIGTMAALKKYAAVIGRRWFLDQRASTALHS